MKNKNMEENKGITLIALIITIIVMLILVAVAVNTAVNSGLFGHAKNATQKWADRESEESELGSNVDDIVSQYVPESLEKALENFTKNPENYKHPDQSSTNGDRAIGTDGKAVNMDLWQYEVESVEDPDGNMWNIAALAGGFGSNRGEPSYANENIVDGKIQGTVPQYIKVDGDEKIYTVFIMSGTFSNCENLTVAPKIPETVIEMDGTFEGCINLIKAPEIPKGVMSMRYIFYGCTRLTNAPEIPEKVTDMYFAFCGCTSLTGIIKINAKEIDISTYCFSGIINDLTIQVPVASTTYEEFNTEYASSSNITIETF